MIKEKMFNINIMRYIFNLDNYNNLIINKKN